MDNKICYAESGKRIKERREYLGLTLEESEIISVPGIKQLPLTLECKVLYKQRQDPDQIPAAVIERYYPEVTMQLESGANRDYHTAYYAEIVNACKNME